jgi:hypothetical protein
MISGVSDGYGPAASRFGWSESVGLPRRIEIPIHATTRRFRLLRLQRAGSSKVRGCEPNRRDRQELGW